jgi:hypothetical protein
MFTLGIPKKDYRRTTQVLGYESAEEIPYDATLQDDGFYIFTFPEVKDEYDFRKIANKLKGEGIRIIGADNQLTERNIMKLADLITEEFSKNLDESDSDTLIQALKNTLIIWETKQYANDKARWEEYYMDIEELIEDFEEDRTIDTPSPYSLANMQEQKLRNIIRKTIRK